MTFLEACQSVREGNFVSHHSFDYTQSMHEYNGDLYYEDGANLTQSGFEDILPDEEWSREGWFVKHSKEQVNLSKLKELHDMYKSKMLPYDKTYEECIVK